MRFKTNPCLTVCHLSFVIVLLTGCGFLTPSPTASPTSTPLPAPPTATPTPAPTTESGPTLVTLRLWLPEELSPYGDEPGADFLAQQLADFDAAYPDLQVEVVVKKARGRGGLLDFLRTARDAAPSVLPDLMVLDAFELGPAGAASLVQPLDGFLLPAIADDRFPFATEMGSVGEQTMGVVIAADMVHLAYHPALVNVPPVFWTQVVTPPISFLFPAAGISGQVNDATLIQYLAAGGTLADAEGNPALDKEALVSVLGFYSDCIGTGAISPAAVLSVADEDRAWEPFQTGVGEMAAVRAHRYWLEADESVAAAPLPTRGGRPFSIVRTWAMTMVATDPARQALAALLLDWLIAPERNARWTQEAGYLPGTRSVLQLWDISDADRLVLRSLMETAVPAPRPELLTAVGPAIQGALETVLTGRASPAEAAAAALESLGQ